MYSLTPTKPDGVFMNKLIVKKAMSKMNCHKIGRIVAFHKEELTCDVQILELIQKPNGGTSEYGVLQQLPLVIEGNDNSHITFGNIVGSECLVHFNDRDIDNWFKTGQTYSPNSSRLHDLSDGFVTLRPYSKANSFSYYENGIEIKNGNTIIHLNNDGTVEISNGSCIFNMSGDTINITGNLVVSGTVTASDCISDTISGKTHIHSGGTIEGMTGVPQ